MTVVVALRCGEGIVLASDSQETAGITKDVMRKLWDIDGRIAWGAAGSTSLFQQLELGAQSLRPNLDDPYYALRDRIVTVTTALQRKALSEHVAVPNAQPSTLEALFCWYGAEGDGHILQVSSEGSGSNFRDDAAAIGSGGPFGQVALASVGHLNTVALDLERLKLVAYKAVQDVIVTSAWGVGWPIQMYTVTPDEGAVLLTNEDVEAVRDGVYGWLELQRAVLGVLGEEFPEEALAAGEEPPSEEDDEGLEPPPADEAA